MEFIKAEEFLGQPVEVQKVFMNWWKCELGDLYIDNKEYEADKTYYDINCVNMNLEGDIEGDWKYFKTISTPIFSEGQLRQFIEDKTHKITVIEFDYDHYNIVQRLGKAYITEESELFQAYWKVAIRIAKE